MAGPYLNVENNQAWQGSDALGGVTELHIGYKANVSDNASLFGQLGPAFLTPDGGDSSTQLSGKVGGDVGLSDNLQAYGEFSFVTAEGDADNGYGTKLGMTYSF